VLRAAITFSGAPHRSSIILTKSPLSATPAITAPAWLSNSLALDMTSFYFVSRASTGCTAASRPKAIVNEIILFFIAGLLYR
jgi:hypothetical protein